MELQTSALLYCKVVVELWWNGDEKGALSDDGGADKILTSRILFIEFLGQFHLVIERRLVHLIREDIDDTVGAPDNLGEMGIEEKRAIGVVELWRDGQEHTVVM